MKKIAVLLGILLLCILTGCDSAPEQAAPAETANFTLQSVDTESIAPLRYWRYTPTEPTEKMPLIVYLHGRSGIGDDPNVLIDTDGFPQYLRDGRLGDVRAYVAIPQLPSDRDDWMREAGTIRSLVETLEREYGIDPENVSLTGHSMGGAGVWVIAGALPGVFARIAPISGGVRDVEEAAEKLKNVPIRAFVGELDEVVPPESSVELVKRIRERGGDAEVTVLEGTDHRGTPYEAYLGEDYRLIDWLIGKS